MPVTAAPGASAAWSALPPTARPRFERVFSRLARREKVQLKHEKSGRWSNHFRVSRGKTISVRGSRRDRVYLRPEAGGYVVLGFSDRTDTRLYRK